MESEGFDFLRLAQLYFIQGELSSFLEAMGNARRRLWPTSARFHVLLEDARVAAQDGEPRQARKGALAALDFCVDLRYPRGMADALQIVGDSYVTEGHDDALLLAAECYVASLVIYPYEGHPQVLATYESLEEVLGVFSGGWGRSKTWTHWAEAVVKERLEERRGAFQYLRHVVADRSRHIASLQAALLARISEGTPFPSDLAHPRLGPGCRVCPRRSALCSLL